AVLTSLRVSGEVRMVSARCGSFPDISTGRAAGGWRRNGRKIRCVKKGDLSGQGMDLRRLEGVLGLALPEQTWPAAGSGADRSERMLTALEVGVKGGVWFSLIDKVYLRGNLAQAMAKVVPNQGAAGVDHVTVEQFALHAEENLRKLEQQLRQATYRPQSIRR